MKKRLLALFLVLAVLFTAALTFADDFYDDEDFGDDEFEEETEFEEEDGQVDFRTVAGYDTGEKFVCGDFVYQLNSDDNTAYTVSYNGVGTDIVVPDKLDDHTVTAIGDFTFNFQDKIQTVQLYKK